jgi:hypothetical protein
MVEMSNEKEINIIEANISAAVNKIYDANEESGEFVSWKRTDEIFKAGVAFGIDLAQKKMIAVIDGSRKQL